MKRFPFPGEAKEIRCTTDAWHEARALDCEQRKESYQEVFDAGSKSLALCPGAADRPTLSCQPQSGSRACRRVCRSGLRGPLLRPRPGRLVGSTTHGKGAQG